MASLNVVDRSAKEDLRSGHDKRATQSAQEVKNLLEL
jgi:hypothetical protein